MLGKLTPSSPPTREREPRGRPPHPATVAQPKAPHPATVAQPKAPHPATVAQPKAPHPATAPVLRGAGRMAQRAMAARVSDSQLALLVPPMKKHIRRMVHGVYGAATDAPGELDGWASELPNYGATTQSRNCAAVVAVDDDKLVFAWNQNRATATNEYASTELPWNYMGARVINANELGDRDPNKHAEMKILDYLATSYPNMKFSEIGISQPCCMLCAAVMIVVGQNAATRGYHEKNVTNWVCPDVVRNSSAYLRRFIGDTAYAAVNGNVENARLVLSRLAQNHNDWSKVPLT